MNDILVGVLTVSDRCSRGEREDFSGPALVNLVREQGWQVIETAMVPDDIAAITGRLQKWAQDGRIHLVLTTGGTGFAPRDVTPEASLQVIERLTPGIPELMRSESLKITPHGALSRSVAGIAGRTLIINFPGSPKAASENFNAVLPILTHALQLIREDLNAEDGHAFSRGPA